MSKIKLPMGVSQIPNMSGPIFGSESMLEYINGEFHHSMSDYSLPYTILISEEGGCPERLLQMYQFYCSLKQSLVPEAERPTLSFNIFRMQPLAVTNKAFDISQIMDQIAPEGHGAILHIPDLGSMPAQVDEQILFGLIGTERPSTHLLSPQAGYPRRLVITFTEREWKRIVTERPHMATISRVIKAPKLLDEDVIDVLKLELGHDLNREVAHRIIDQSNRYVRDMVQPGAALKVMNLAKTIDKTIPLSAVDKAISFMTNVDASRLSLPSSGLADSLKSKIFGQDAGVETIARGIKRGINSLSTRPRTLYNVMIYGESGIGKTLLAEELAELLTGKREFLRIDCGELGSHETAVAQLIGMPIGYRGFEQGGKITEFVRKNPSGVILLDEKEKANPEVLNLFMRALDTGSIASATGETFDLSNYVFVGTTNAGVQKEKVVGFGTQAAKHDPIKELSGHFKPEYLYRWDDVIEFKPLDKKALAAISAATIKNMIARAKEKGLAIALNDDDIITMSEEVSSEAKNGRQAHKLATRRFQDHYLD